MKDLTSSSFNVSASSGTTREKSRVVFTKPDRKNEIRAAIWGDKSDCIKICSPSMVRLHGSNSSVSCLIRLHARSGVPPDRRNLPRLPAVDRLRNGSWFCILFYRLDAKGFASRTCHYIWRLLYSWSPHTVCVPRCVCSSLLWWHAGTTWTPQIRPSTDNPACLHYNNVFLFEVIEVV